MRVADKIAEFLHEKGVRTVFGIIGAGNVVLFDAISRLGVSNIVPLHHEQACVMASAYHNRITHTISSVCIVTTGGGSSNALTGVLAAYMDSIPVVVISGNEPSHFFSKSHPRVVGVQGYESHSLVAPIVKYSQRAITGADAMNGIEYCIKTAISPRQGPCWIDIPQDIQRMEA